MTDASRSLHLLPNGGGANRLARCWQPVAEDSDEVRRMVPPRGLRWIVALGVPVDHRKATAFFEASPVVGVLPGLHGSARVVTVRPVGTALAGHAVLRQPLPVSVFIRLIGLNDPDVETVAALMLNDWLDDSLFSDHLIYRDLIR